MAVKKLFISYSHADAALLAILKTHLKPLERASVIAPWFDGYLLPGDDIDAQVRSALENAELVALLVSPDFLASDYCYDVEMQAAVARHEKGEARVVPIIVRDCQWQRTPFGRLMALPTDGRPIMSGRWTDKDEAWTVVARGVEAAAHASCASPGAAPRSFEPPKVLVPATNAEAAPMGVVSKKHFTDKNRDAFRNSVFEFVAHRFEVSIAALSGDLSGSFRRIDANRFIGTIYRAGKKAAGCTVWIGGSFQSDSICYVSNDGGETNSMNEWLSIEPVGDSLGLKPSMARQMADQALDPDAAAQHLWALFTERLKHT